MRLSEIRVKRINMTQEIKLTTDQMRLMSLFQNVTAQQHVIV